MINCQQDGALHCANVDKTYHIKKDIRVWHIFLNMQVRGQAFPALRGITMNVPKGKIVGILGKNGSGKSTLLRVLGGVYRPTRGSIEVSGRIAGLFELGGMGNQHLTGREYAKRYLSIMGASYAEIIPLLDEIQSFSELEEAFDHRIRTYSSGMGARLYFATTTAMQYEIYLIDELLSVGDEHFQGKCWQRMRQRLIGGASGVLVTHDWTAILKLCEQTHVLDRGQFVFSGVSDQAVVSYVKVPMPDATVARFSSCNPQNHRVQSGKDGNIKIWVDVLKPMPVDIGVSIEMLRIGVGWEIILLASDIPVAERPGCYAVNISIPNLPLAPGDYSLNVFLDRRKVAPQDPSEGFDIRSWTTGNGLSLQVEGEETKSSVKLPFVARKLAEVP